MGRVERRAPGASTLFSSISTRSAFPFSVSSSSGDGERRTVGLEGGHGDVAVGLGLAEVRVLGLRSLGEDCPTRQPAGFGLEREAGTDWSRR